MIIIKDPLKVGSLFMDEYMDYKGYAKLFGCLQRVTKAWFERGLIYTERKGKKYAKIEDVYNYICGGYA